VAAPPTPQACSSRAERRHHDDATGTPCGGRAAITRHHDEQ
jgi:hypothetical protein